MNLTKKNKKTSKKEGNLDDKLNNLRAGVLGSNDGILTVVGVLFSVAVATPNQFTIFIAGLSDLLACAFSMSSGEYASVSSQRDTEKAAVQNEKKILKNDFDQELQTTQEFYTNRGVNQETAREIAVDLLNKKPLETIIDIKYDIKINKYLNPWSAALSSLISASLGGILPLLAMTLLPIGLKWPGTILAVIIAVALTGFLSAKLGDGLVKIAIYRNIIVGIITMIIHYSIGKIF
ncbi:VIT family protein [Lactobacillus sp. S2-2]|uniref:VIT1/CCC1 transporter family protein n=1 Tax=Lactobacillus sp. S2-2 TaxID=2692917 RepID=UPI001F1590D6|nr:VIT family protein [Lactobacillus sp. S2-2]MCF6514701.1 VIT family protein [Lactobacillus sp. S2-2]